MAIDKKLIFWKKQSTFNAPSSITDTTGSVMWYSIVFFKDTGQIWTNGTYYNCGIWGTPQTNYVPLTIGGTSYNLSRDGHTHAYFNRYGPNSEVYDINSYFDGIRTGYQWVNAPLGGIGTLQSIVYSNDWISQEFTSIGSVPSKFIRCRHSGTTWGDWNLFWHSGNSNLSTRDWTVKDLRASNKIFLTATSGARDILMGNQDSAGVNSPSIIRAANGNLYFGVGTDWVNGGTMTQNLIISKNGNISAPNTITAGSFVKSGVTNEYMLLAGGGHKAISDFTASLITSTTANGVTNVITGNTNTYLNVVQGNTSSGSSTQITGTGSVTVTSDAAGKLSINGSTDATTLGGYGAAYYEKGVGVGSYYKDVVNISYHNTAQEILIKTKIPFISSSQMPLIHLEGYAYGSNAPIELRIAFYVYNSSFVSMGCTSTCPWDPQIKLCTYIDGGTTYIAVGLIKSIYFPQCTVNYIDVWGGGAGYQSRNYSKGWAVEYNASASPSIIPTDNLVSVPYKPIANSITGNASTATNATNAATATNLSRSIIAGNGLTGGGELNSNRTITLGTPSAITATSTNSVVAESHTHLLQSVTLDLTSGLNADVDGFISGITNSPIAGSSVMGTWTTLRGTTSYGAGFFARNNQAWFRTREAGTMQSWNEIWHKGNLTNLNQLTNGPGFITSSSNITGNASTATVANSIRTYLTVTDTSNVDHNTDGLSVFRGTNSATGLPSGSSNAWNIINIGEGGNHGTSNPYRHQLYFGTQGVAPYVRSQSGGAFSAWERILTSSDLNGYLPLSGGELTRYLSINTPNSGGSSYIAFKRNNVDVGYIGDGASGPNTGIAVHNYISGKSLSLGNDGILRYGGNIVMHDGSTNFTKFSFINNAALNWDTLDPGLDAAMCYRVESNVVNPPESGVYNWTLWQQGNIYRGSQIAIHAYGNGTGAWIRSSTTTGTAWNNWRKIAFEDSNVATATKLSTTRNNWGTNGVIENVVGQLAWKNYSNGHTIFDASNGTTPNGTACNKSNAEIPWAADYPSLMGWNGTNTFGVRVDSARIADSTTNASFATKALGLNSTYNGGGSEKPDYFVGYGLKVQMLNVGTGWADCIYFNGYNAQTGSGQDVPWVNMLVANKTGDDDWYHVRSTHGSTSWGTLKKFLDSSNFSSYALPLTGGTLTGSLNINYSYSTSFTGNDITFSRTDGSSYINAGQTLSLGAGGTSGVLNLTNANVATFKELLLADGARIYSSAGAGLGISLFNEPSFNPNYGLMFAQTVYKGAHGAVNGDWATYFTMSPDAGRGWIFTSSAADSSGNVASISNTGNMTLNGYLQVQGGTNPAIKSLSSSSEIYMGSNLYYKSVSGIKEFIMTSRIYNINPTTPTYSYYNPVPVVLWHGRVTITSSSVSVLTYNYGAISLTGTRLGTGTARLDMVAQYGAELPSSSSDYIVVGCGLGCANTTGSTAYFTIPDTYKYGNNFRIVISDDSTANDGYVELMIIRPIRADLRAN